MELLKDLWGFMKERKKIWLAPVIVILVLLGALIVIGGGSSIAPFIYTLFCIISTYIYLYILYNYVYYSIIYIYILEIYYIL